MRCANRADSCSVSDWDEALVSMARRCLVYCQLGQYRCQTELPNCTACVLVSKDYIDPHEQARPFHRPTPGRRFSPDRYRMRRHEGRRDQGPLARPGGRDDLRAHAADDAAGGGHAAAAADVGRVHRAGARRRGGGALGGLPAGHPRALAAARATGCRWPSPRPAWCSDFHCSPRWPCARSRPCTPAVIVGVLPLATAAVGAWLHRQRPAPASGCAPRSAARWW